MAYEYYIDEDVNCVFVRHSGIYTVEEGSRQYEKLLANPDHKSGMNFLRDLRGASYPEDYSYKNITNVVEKNFERVDLTLGECRMAILVKDREDYIFAHKATVTTRLSTGNSFNSNCARRRLISGSAARSVRDGWHSGFYMHCRRNR